ncbi:alpha/beta fold hydrolase [Umezawaea endophytica]|uniref:Alpha/beta hydrolase n=1 Tax=Umezawaea endophytica TaxID=1654476 RepID=A0A9X2VN83_9PSEU|nr:alpha/beta hydrolase [Umezawaea endophytica]MCS7479710.1 alpha/beta hydrolase [Umezawaea endophytica]
MATLVPAAVKVKDGTELNVVISGPPSDVTVVLLHGWTLDLTSWNKVAESLPGRVLRYDHRGHGHSGGGTVRTLDQLADDLAEVLETHAPNENLVLAGHSMGGMTMMALAERHPQVYERVQGAVFVATSPGSLPPVRAMEQLLGRWLARRTALGFARTMPLGLRAMLFGKRANWKDVAATSKMISRCTGNAFTDFRYELATHDRAKALAELTSIPAAILAGSSDLLTPPRHARAIATELPQAELVIYPGAGHMLPMERATEVAARIKRYL